MIKDELTAKIKAMKKREGYVVLVHSYCRPEVQAVADFTGDSLGLCLEARKTGAETIVFCGVRFMAESAKLLNPRCRVLPADEYAGCPMADMIEPRALREFKGLHPGAVVVCYVNSTAAVKSESDICCTSSNAEKVVRSIPSGKEIIFIPDKNLGAWVSRKTGRKLILWEGSCPVHDQLTIADIEKRRNEHPDAVVLVHPEARMDVLLSADEVGSTEYIYRYCIASDRREFVIGTEIGLVERLRSVCPDKRFWPASDSMICRDMKLTRLESVLECMESGRPVVEIPEEIGRPAALAMERMIDLGP